MSYPDAACFFFSDNNRRHSCGISVKEICSKAGISRNAFYQHYRYKEDLFDQMVDRATEKIRESLHPIVPDVSHSRPEDVASYAQQIIGGISEVRDLICIMLKRDHGIFLRELTDLIFNQFLTDGIRFFDLKDSKELRLFYEYQAAEMAAFLIRWIREYEIPEKEAAELLTGIMLQNSAGIPLKPGE